MGVVSYPAPHFWWQSSKTSRGIPIVCLATKKGTFLTAVAAQQHVSPHIKLENQAHLSIKRSVAKNGAAVNPSVGTIPSAESQTAVAAQRGAIGGGGSGRDDNILKICSQEQVMQSCTRLCTRLYRTVIVTHPISLRGKASYEIPLCSLPWLLQFVTSKIVPIEQF